jgi:glycerol-3-phosphate dehydrogenase
LVQRLRERRDTWDLVVVGAGITGAGIARDAALRGLSVLVVEAHDVAFGTSSRSTRLIHGGVRYLEQGELGLVYEALRERSRLYEAAAHLVRPARFLFPAYRGDRLGPWKLRLGLTLYDTLNFHRGQAHDYLDPEATLMTEPLLRAEGLRGAVQYEDAVTDDARLTLAILVDARRHGAQVLTYARVDKLEGSRGAHTVTLEDGTSVAARAVVVAAGPWTGPGLLGTRGENLLSLSKGTHIVVRSRDVPVRQPLVIQAKEQRRILFAVPWGTRTYLGTTDSAYEGDPGASSVTAQDEDEILDLVRRILPGARLDRGAIVSTWSGVRPLVRAEGDDSTVELSRKHRIVEREDGVLAIVGGKLTTYRSMAQELVDDVVARLLPTWPDDRPRPLACSTQRLPLVPGDPLDAMELEDPVLADLNPRHGPAARDLDHKGRAGERLVHDLPYRWCEVDHAIAHEGVCHVIDIVRRRLPLVLTDAAQGGAIARRVAVRLIDATGGEQRDIEDELERYRHEVHVETGRAPPAD